MKHKPPIIDKVGFDFRWDNRKVWALEIEPEEMPVSELEWILDIPFLAVDTDWGYELTAREVLENPDKYPYQIERTKKADIRYPIDIMWNKERWLILDGLHRLMRQIMEGKTTVMVRKVSRDLIPQITKD